jgi:uncharacterized protein (DUF427 family)
MKAKWNGKVIAESNETIDVEGNQYFPPQVMKNEFFKDSSHSSTCHWKGKAHYYHVEVDGKINEDSAWYYPQPKEAANKIKDYVAFWKGIEVTE